MRAGFRGLLNFIALATLYWWAPPGRAADSLVWRTGQVDAEIEAWPLPKVLESIASATGWQIYLQPDTRYTVTTRFHKLKLPDALRRLLGELNFALLPQSGGPTKLFIYRTSVNEATQLIRTAGKSKAESAVIPNELIVALKPGHTLAAAEIHAHCAANLARFKCPSRIEFVDALPRNATGKIHKPTLRRNFSTPKATDISAIAS